MSDADDAQKTEEPTQRKLDEARRRGQVAVSREVNTWLMLMAGALAILMLMPGMMTDLKGIMLRFVEAPHLFRLDPSSTGRLLFDTSVAVGQALLVPILLFFAVALLAGLVQNGFLFAPKALEMKLEKFSPISGFKRLFSIRQLVEFLKGLLKIAVVAAVGAAPLIPLLPHMDVVPTFAMVDVLHMLYSLVLRMLGGVLAVLAVVAIADLVFQRMQQRKQLRMSKQEVRDEFKQSEGDPMIKQRLRQIRQERARRRMMQAVPEADVVVTNPTHYAVALKYVPEEMEAPKLVAKGQDLVALRIREIAEEHGVTIMENPPLARVLYANVELDQEVPPEHYETVAQVISYVWGVKGRRMPGAAAG